MKQMTLKRNCCGCLFWSKVLLALLIALAAIGAQAFLIAQMRQFSVENPPLVLPTPVIPFPSQFDSNVSACYHSNPTARLLPPPGVFMFGFNLEWNKETPTDVVKKLGHVPPIFK